MEFIMGLLPLVGIAFPAAAPVLAIVSKVAPLAIAALPVIQAAFKEGIPALHAAEQAAPELAASLRELARHIPNVAGLSAAAHLENVARAAFGFHPMTPEEERRWMDGATGGNDPNIGMGG